MHNSPIAVREFPSRSFSSHDDGKNTLETGCGMDI